MADTKPASAVLWEEPQNWSGLRLPKEGDDAVIEGNDAGGGRMFSVEYDAAGVTLVVTP